MYGCQPMERGAAESDAFSALIETERCSSPSIPASSAKTTVTSMFHGYPESPGMRPRSTSAGPRPTLPKSMPPALPPKPADSARSASLYRAPPKEYVPSAIRPHQGSMTRLLSPVCASSSSADSYPSMTSTSGRGCHEMSVAPRSATSASAPVGEVSFQAGSPSNSCWVTAGTFFVMALP